MYYIYLGATDRHYLLIHDQTEALVKFCNCFARLPFPLLFLALLLHPKYCKIGITTMEHNIVTLADVVKFISGDDNRWILGDVNPSAAVVEWKTYDSCTTWASHASSCNRIPHQFWCLGRRMWTLHSSVHAVAMAELQFSPCFPTLPVESLSFPHSVVQCHHVLSTYTCPQSKTRH